MLARGSAYAMKVCVSVLLWCLGRHSPPGCYQGNCQNAIVDFTKAIGIDSTLADAYKRRGQTYAAVCVWSLQHVVMAAYGHRVVWVVCH